MNILKIYTDGACSGNQNDENIGGWGAILEYGEASRELYGGEENTTNNKMEMTALIEALSALKKDNQTIEVYSDSSYLMDCFRKKWYESWQKNGWITSKKTPVENKDLWEKLLQLTANHSISFYRVKGHITPKMLETDQSKLYNKFKEWNGSTFSLEDFKYIVDKNNRADELANKGMERFRK